MKGHHCNVDGCDGKKRQWVDVRRKTQRDGDKKEAALSERLFAISLSLCIGLEGRDQRIAISEVSRGHFPHALESEPPYRKLQWFVALS